MPLPDPTREVLTAFGPLFYRRQCSLPPQTASGLRWIVMAMVVGQRLPSLERVLQNPETAWQKLTLDQYGEGKRTLEICVKLRNKLDPQRYKAYVVNDTWM